MSVSAMRLVTAEFYGAVDPEELIGAVDLPAGRMIEYTHQVGDLLCRIRKRDSMNAVIIDEQGNAVERLMVFRRRGK